VWDTLTTTLGGLAAAAPADPLLTVAEVVLVDQVYRDLLHREAAPLGPGGVAVLTTALVPQGTHSVSATYSGDAGFQPGTSAALAEQVLAANTVVTFDPASGIWHLGPNSRPTSPARGWSSI
jgi:hypothetical protein